MGTKDFFEMASTKMQSGVERNLAKGDVRP